jgi:hypothetical protein
LALVRSGKLPSDIPKWPNISYGRTIYTGKPKRGGFWVSWKDWIGVTLVDQLESIKSKLDVLIIARDDSLPNTVYTFAIINDFEYDIKQKAQSYGRNLLRMYYTNKTFDWGGTLDRVYNNYYSIPGAYVIPNINELYYHFDMHMDKYIP